MNLRIILIASLVVGSFAQAAPLFGSKFRVNKDFATEIFADTIPVEARTFQQKLDHSNILDRRQFTQNYWVSKGYAVNENSPVLLYFCGETACSEADVKYMLPWAQTINASVVVIEHRYYGGSQPFPTTETKNLRWMSMTQALADFAQIVKQLKKEGMTGPWIVSGGSYSGILSSSFRLYYPQLVTGSWASSAPVHTISDDKSYDVAMSQAMGPECSASLRKVVQQAEVAVSNPESFAKLRHQFGADAMVNGDDFLFGIADVAAAAVQYRMTSTLCGSFKTDDVMQDYAAFLATMAESFGYNMFSYSFVSAMDTKAGGPASDLRLFFYQQCNEYGLFQTAADPQISVRSQRLNMDYMRQGCQRLFGRSFQDGTPEFNRRYFEPLLNAKSSASEIYFTNGSTDPWMPLGITEPNGTWTNPNIYASMIDGAAHCDDLSFKRQTTTQPLKDAAANIKMLLKKWSR